MSNESQSVPQPPALAPLSTLEKWGLASALVVFALYQLHAAMNHGSWGQDFHAHLGWIKEAFEKPREFMTTYKEGRTNPPLYHYLCAKVMSLVSKKWDANTVNLGLPLLAIFSAVLHVLGLLALYQVLRRIIHSAVLRLACMLLLLFSPFAMIHSLVVASDALLTPLFFFALYQFVLLAEPQPRNRFVRIVLGLSFVLLLCIATKFTAMSMVPAAAIVLAALWRTGILSRGRLAMAAVMIVLIPGCFAFWAFSDYKSQQSYTLGIKKYGTRDPNGFNPRSLVLPRRADLHLIRNALSYDAKAEDGVSLDIIIPNHYSYLGLVHVSMFTDMMNIYQYDPTDAYFGPRSDSHARRMRRAVKPALVFTLGAMVALPALFLGSLIGVWRREKRAVNVFMLAILSLAFFMNIVVFLPFVPAYGGGYWLPRLVAPALISFFVLLFVGLDRLCVGRWRTAAWGCLFFVVIQSYLHLSFLWVDTPPA